MARSWVLWLLSLGRPALAADLADYALPMMGATNGGNTFPGVSRPFGMVKLGPDLYTGGDAYSGYQPDGVFTGFSVLHMSGTGGAPKYGVVSQMPVLGDIPNPLAELTDTRSAPDASEIGYYNSSLGSGIGVELAAAERAGMYQYTFPSNSSVNNVVVDVSHVLPSFRGMGLEQHYLGGDITVDNDGGSIRYHGSGSYDNGWNRSPKWTVYFCGYFDSAPTFKTFLGDGNKAAIGLAQYSTEPSVSSTARLGTVFTFKSTTVRSRVGVSFISSDQACQNVNNEIPPEISIATLRSQTRDTWNAEVFSKITTTDTSNLFNLQLLYSSLYHMLLVPTNKTGENPNWKSSEPYYDDIFTLWDLFRCTTPLFHILSPSHYSGFIRSLIDTYRHDGYTPDARSSFSNGATQGGSNADNVLADAFVKGVGVGVNNKINWSDGYAAMVQNAETPPPPNDDPRDRTSSTKEGRGALPDWLKYGYITTRYGRSVTRAVEYAVNDFSLAQVAFGMRKCGDMAKYLHRSRYWRNHWDLSVTSLNHTGFLVPRDAETGGFVKQDPLDCGGCYWADAYYEANAWEYSFNAHHDVDTLIALSGGPVKFKDRLDTFFAKGLFNPGNEPSFTTPYLYHFVGRQDLAVYHSRKVAKERYKPTPDGLPGNSDAGAMESWVIWVMLGLYPLTGQTTFLIGSPWFEEVSIDLGEGKRLRITTTGGSEDAYYVQSLKVNGQEWKQSWVSWDDVFANGGEMDFVLGSEPVRWATGDTPPSPASEFDVTDDPETVLGTYSTKGNNICELDLGQGRKWNSQLAHSVKMSRVTGRRERYSRARVGWF